MIQNSTEPPLPLDTDLLTLARQETKRIFNPTPAIENPRVSLDSEMIIVLNDWLKDPAVPETNKSALRYLIWDIISPEPQSS